MKIFCLFLLWMAVACTSSCGRSQKKKNVEKEDIVEQEQQERMPLPGMPRPMQSYNNQEATRVDTKLEQIKVSREHKAHLVSGWYNQLPTQLNAELDQYFHQAINHLYVEADPDQVRALIVPHAGYHYAGLCAATAYQTLLSSKNLAVSDVKNKKIKRVIVLAPSHHVPVQGIALPDYTSYRTILGTLQTDENALDSLASYHLFKVNAQAHMPEHAVEMQLHLLQKSIEQFQLVPLVVGKIDDRQLNEAAGAIKEIITPETLVVVSSDFMHHGARYDYQVFNKNIINQIRLVDSLAIEAINKQSCVSFEKVLHETGTTICGQNPLRLFLKLLEMDAWGERLESRLTCYYTSAHLKQARHEEGIVHVSKLLAGVPDDQVGDCVSYIGMVFTHQNIAALKKENQLTGFEKMELVHLSRAIVENSLKKEQEQLAEHFLWPVTSFGLEQASGVFVTLKTKEDKLRGCIGKVVSQFPLYRTVIEMSKAAAFKDSRFSPVTLHELQDLTFDVTVLALPRSISGFHEIVLGKHGIILKKFAQDGTLEAHALFLPQVPTEHGWDLRTTLTQLSIKAGLGPDGWKKDCEFQVFEGFEIKEEK